MFLEHLDPFFGGHLGQACAHDKACYSLPMINPTPVVLPDSATWSCGGCTACCRHFALGPVADETVSRLESLGIREAWKPAADGFAVRRPGPDGAPAWFFQRREDGACLFLRDDGKCTIHANFGGEAKPSFCQEYPFAFVTVDDERRAFVRGDCGGWAESVNDGEGIGPQASALSDLVRAHPEGHVSDQPLVILPGLALDLSALATVEHYLMPELQRARPPLEMLGASAQLLASLVKRPLPEPDPARIGAAIAFIHGRVHQVVREGMTASESQGLTPPEKSAILAYLSETERMLAAAAPGMPAGPDTPWSAPQLHTSALEFRAILLPQQAHGMTYMELGGLPIWLSAMTVGVLISAAACGSEGPISAKMLGPNLATWIRLTRHPTTRRVFSELTPALTTLFLAAPRSA